MFRLRLSQFRAVHITDDRGAECKLVSPPERWPEHHWFRKSKEPLDAALTVECEWANASARMFGGAIGLLMIITIPVSRWLLSPLPPLTGWIGSLAPAVVGAIIVRPLYQPISLHERKRRAASLRAAYLQVGKCPSCGYGLAGLPMQADGCTVCPECSKAWRDRPGSNEHPVNHVTR